MDYRAIIDKYYPHDDELKQILLTHSRCVARKALQMAALHPELKIDTAFVEEAAMLHDVGIFLVDAPGIHCHGSEPYIRHGILGAQLLRREGYPRHALVCERHTGTGLTRAQIEAQQLPLPPRDFVPQSLEEQLICFADTFFSKTRPDEEKTLDRVKKSVSKFGPEGVEQIEAWCRIFM